MSYLRIWTEPDVDQCRAFIEQMWIPRGSLCISSPALIVTGTADIAGHISRVRSNRIAGQGLVLSYDQRMESDGALSLCWSMTTPNGDVVGRGIDTVFRDTDGKMIRAYMFIGVS